MAQVNAYFIFNGHCEAAFEHYKSVFGGAYRDFNRFGDFPPDEQHPIPADYLDKIMHISLPISAETIIMGSDAPPHIPPVVFGENLSLSVNTDSKEEADRIFHGLARGGEITMPIEKTFWGAYFGMLKDPFGITWMVNFDEK